MTYTRRNRDVNYLSYGLRQLKGTVKVFVYKELKLSCKEIRFEKFHRCLYG